VAESHVDRKIVAMSLAKALDVSLKDFLPQTRGRLIGLKSAGPVLISERLHLRLKQYATNNGLSVALVLERLRDEIYRESK
jgi:hypothetical protein